jgi:hypothetical protein
VDHLIRINYFHINISYLYQENSCQYLCNYNVNNFL